MFSPLELIIIILFKLEKDDMGGENPILIGGGRQLKKRFSLILELLNF